MKCKHKNNEWQGKSHRFLCLDCKELFLPDAVTFNRSRWEHVGSLNQLVGELGELHAVPRNYTKIVEILDKYEQRAFGAWDPNTVPPEWLVWLTDCSRSQARRLYLYLRKPKIRPYFATYTLSLAAVLRHWDEAEEIAVRTEARRNRKLREEALEWKALSDRSRAAWAARMKRAEASNSAGK